MGTIYLGQLPPAEIARLKAELAETLIANFCYPRFYDYRTNSLRMRPVDRAKRQEVWLFLSSVDFTAWSRVDLMSVEFQHHVERLFIQFVQRNRSFFGEQGRKRMSDIKMLIGTSGSAVAQGLRNHLTGRPNTPPFGSPRPAISWAAPANGRTEPTWEQIAASTAQLQQQLAELRGEAKAAVASEPRTAATNGSTKRPVKPTPAPEKVAETVAAKSVSSVQVNTRSNPSAPTPKIVPPPTSPVAPAASVAVPAAPARKQETAPNQTTVAPGKPPTPKKTSGPLPAPTPAKQTSGPLTATAPQVSATAVATPTRNGSSAPAPAIHTTTNVASTQREANIMPMAEDDVAIFEQMRHQLMIWLRVEAIQSGLEINGQGPTQLLELLRQQGRLDETRLQVVSTLLNLSNQVIKTGVVTALDYKQALMFHLMHTRR